MKSFFDTSVLIPVFLEDHEHHEASFALFEHAEKEHSSGAAHSLAEIYAVLTRLPGRYRLSGHQVMLFLQNIRERVTLVGLGPNEYYAALQDAAAAGIVGGTIYDALLVRCALKVEAGTIYTWNVKHFRQFGPDVWNRIKTP